MAATSGWQHVFKPFLESKVRNSWIDPRTLTEEELKWRYSQAFHFAKACEEILEFVDKKINEARGLREIESGDKTEPFREVFK